MYIGNKYLGICNKILNIVAYTKKWEIKNTQVQFLDTKFILLES